MRVSTSHLLQQLITQRVIYDIWAGERSDVYFGNGALRGCDADGWAQLTRAIKGKRISGLYSA